MATKLSKSKRADLARAGWKVGSTRELLELGEEEVRFIELKLALAAALRRKRERARPSQTGLAKLIESSQSRVVTLDLIVRSPLAMGTSPRELARIISGAKKAA